ncbi:MAG TPA: hypothetical protein VMT85_09540 [Thermoanaerobaculia bacterium]|nr:hypothetical protein [Thermoanaerobaculia bacterium]
MTIPKLAHQPYLVRAQLAHNDQRQISKAPFLQLSKGPNETFQVLRKVKVRKSDHEFSAEAESLTQLGDRLLSFHLRQWPKDRLREGIGDVNPLVGNSQVELRLRLDESGDGCEAVRPRYERRCTSIDITPVALPIDIVLARREILLWVHHRDEVVVSCDVRAGIDLLEDQVSENERSRGVKDIELLGRDDLLDLTLELEAHACSIGGFGTLVPSQRRHSLQADTRMTANLGRQIVPPLSLATEQDIVVVATDSQRLA